jgi:hypothetical protein
MFNLLITNPYFYTLIILFLIHYILKKLDKFPYVKEQYSTEEYIQKLDNYYINNKPYTFFIVIFYFCLAVLPFILLRIMSLGISTDIFSINITKGTIMYIIILVLNISYYLRILNIIFYPYVVKLHIYLRVYSWYDKFADKQTEIDWYYSLSEFIGAITHFAWDMSLSRLELLKNLREELRAHRANKRYKNILLPPAFRQKVRYVAWPYFQNKYFKFFKIWFIDTVVFYIQIHISHFVRYLPYTCLFLSFIYDIYHQELYTIQFAGLFVIITTFISKIRYFLYVKDTAYDNVLTAYFYKNETPYKEVHKNIFDKTRKIPIMLHNKNLLGKQGIMVRYTMEKIINYMVHDFKVHYMINKIRYANFIYRHNIAKRLNILFILLLGNIYYIYNNAKYTMIILGIIKIPLAIVLIPIWVLTYYVHTKIWYIFSRPIPKETKVSPLVWLMVNTTNPEEYRENNKFKYLFVMLWIMQGSIMLYILLKSRLTICPTEIILDGPYISIIETFSYDEKVIYIKKYLENWAATKAPNKGYWIEVFTRMDWEQINKELSLEQIRETIKSLIEEYLNKDKKEEIKEASSRYERIKENIIKWFTTK